MKEISLSNGGSTIVDESEYGHLIKWKWYRDTAGYVVRHDKGRGAGMVYIHRQILGNPSRLVIDHINGDKLDNRLENLRICFQKNNSWNRKGWGFKKMYSPYKGVTKDKRGGKFIAYIMVDGKQITLGRFDNEKNAALAYNEAARKHHGEFALLNEI
jgi:hypothetical protein